MNQQFASLGGVMNSLKWATVIILIALGVVGNYYYSDLLLARVMALLAISVLALSVGLQTEGGRRFWRFVQEVRLELRKVVWPSRPETLQTTLMVLAVVGTVALILWGLDILLLKMVAWLTGYGA